VIEAEAVHQEAVMTALLEADMVTEAEAVHPEADMAIEVDSEEVEAVLKAALQEAVTVIEVGVVLPEDIMVHLEEGLQGAIIERKKLLELS